MMQADSITRSHWRREMWFHLDTEYIVRLVPLWHCSFVDGGWFIVGDFASICP